MDNTTPNAAPYSDEADDRQMGQWTVLDKLNRGNRLVFSIKDQSWMLTNWGFISNELGDYLRSTVYLSATTGDLEQIIYDLTLSGRIALVDHWRDLATRLKSERDAARAEVEAAKYPLYEHDPATGHTYIVPEKPPAVGTDSKVAANEVVMWQAFLSDTEEPE